MVHYKSPGGGIFGGSFKPGARDLRQFHDVGTRPWPPGPRSSVPQSPAYHPAGFSTVGMGEDVSAAVPQAIGPAQSGASAASVPAPIDPDVHSMDPESLMVGRVSAFNYHHPVRPPQGFTPKGGIFDGSAVESGLPGHGAFFEERNPGRVMVDEQIRSLQDPAMRRPVVPTVSIQPTPGPVNGFGADEVSAAQAVRIVGPQPFQVSHAMPSRPIPVSVSFARPRMLGRSIFEGPVVRDSFPRESIMPTLGPVNGFGSGPDGLGSDCGCGSWKRR